MTVSAPAMERSLPMLHGWEFTPEGAVVHRASQTGVIADLHLGYEWARGAAGDCVCAHSLAETLARLSILLARSPLSQLIVAGDLLESSRPCPHTARDLLHLKSWLADRGVDLLALEGNHDVNVSWSVRRASTAPDRLPETCAVAGWTIGHGHRPIGALRASLGIFIRYSGIKESWRRVFWWRPIGSSYRHSRRTRPVAMSSRVPFQVRGVPAHCAVWSARATTYSILARSPACAAASVGWVQPTAPHDSCDPSRKRSSGFPGLVRVDVTTEPTRS